MRFAHFFVGKNGIEPNILIYLTNSDSTSISTNSTEPFYWQKNQKAKYFSGKKKSTS